MKKTEIPHSKNFAAVIVVTLYFCNFLFAQVDTSYISDTKAYASYLDSINRLDHPQNFGFMTSIADGIIKRDNAIVGGFGISTLSNANGDTALRIAYHDNLNINTYKTYYFRQDKLVYAVLVLKNTNPEAKLFFRKEEFYKDNKIIWANPPGNPGRYIDITNFSLLEDGQRFLADFKNGYNRH